MLAWELAARLAADGPAPAVVLIDSATRADPAPGGRLSELKQQVLLSATSALGTVAADEVVATVDAHVEAVARHRVTVRHDGPALLLACGEEEVTERLGDWTGLGAQLRVERLPGGHFDVFSAQTLPVLLRHLDRFLDDTFEPGGRR
ncbi:alpha/beta fold hydrolase [Dactylosporangium cerinum]